MSSIYTINRINTFGRIDTLQKIHKEQEVQKRTGRMEIKGRKKVLSDDSSEGTDLPKVLILLNPSSFPAAVPHLRINPIFIIIIYWCMY